MWVVHCVLSDEADALSKLSLSTWEIWGAMPYLILSAVPSGARSTVSSIASAGTSSEGLLRAADMLYVA